MTLAQRYGPVAAVDCGPLRAVAVAEPAIVEEILVTRQHEFVRDTGATLLRELVGEGLLTTEDPPHIERRRLLQPAFHRARIASYGAAVAAEADRAADALAGRPLVDVGAEMTRYALGAVGAALFGDGLRDGGRRRRGRSRERARARHERDRRDRRLRRARAALAASRDAGARELPVSGGARAARRDRRAADRAQPPRRRAGVTTCSRSSSRCTATASSTTRRSVTSS